LSATDIISQQSDLQGLPPHVFSWQSAVSNAADIREPADAADRYTTSVARDIEAVKQLRKFWISWSSNLETDLEYFLHCLESGATTDQPCVIAVFHHGEAQTILVGRIRRKRMSDMVSYVRVPGPKVRVLEIVGRLGRVSSAIDRVLAGALLQLEDEGEADMVCFPRLSLRSDLYREVEQSNGVRRKTRVPHVFPYSLLPLQGSAGRNPAAFRGKQSHEIRRKTRILQRAFPNQIRLECYSSPIDLGFAIDAVASIASTSWQHHLRSGFSRTREVEQRLRFCADKGWLRIYVMYVRNVPCAFLLGQLYQGTFHCQHAGFDPKVERFSVGSILTSWAFRHLSAKGAKQIDLGEGDQEHNRRLGCEPRSEATVHLYARTRRGSWAKLFFGATQRVRTSGRTTVTELRLDRVLMFWRQSLISWRRYRSASSLSSRPHGGLLENVSSEVIPDDAVTPRPWSLVGH